jgi:hypothetical protein
MELNFIERLKELTANEDVLAVQNEVNELRSKFEDYILEQERQLQIRQLEAKDNGEEAPEAEGDFGKEEFYEVFNAYKALRNAASSEVKAEEERNLNLKRSLVKRLQDVITTEENIGAAFAAFKEIQENWKEIGDIPRKERNAIQSEYSKLIEDFFYNIKIYKDLKDHDLHRNSQLKNDIIAKLKQLVKSESIKEIEQQLKALQNDWEDIGPVPNEEWERLKDSYWTEVRSIYERINRHYEDKRTEQLANISAKRELISSVQQLLEGIGEISSIKDWEAETEKLLSLQNNWKKIGFGPRKENEEVWKEFRQHCDVFFDAKKVYFDGLHSEFDAIASQKGELIAKAEGLKDSTDWVNSANTLIKLQNEWKKLGHSGKKNEQKLWKRFRAACDHFFNARQAHFNEKDKAFEANLALKQAVIEEIKNYARSEDKKQVLNDLKVFAQKFNEIGQVPLKQKDSIYKAFKTALDDHYNSLNLDQSEKEQTLFSAKLETLKASPDSRRQLTDMRMQMRKEIERLQKEINLLENNLGFFARSKGADSLRKDVDKKIEKAQQDIQNIKSRLKLIPNE